MQQHETPTSEHLPGIDLDEGLQRFGGNWDTLRNFIHRFIQLHEGIERKAWRLYHEGDFIALEKLAHRLKGAAGNLSATDLKESARKLESHAQKGSFAAIEAAISGIAQQLEELRAMAERI